MNDKRIIEEANKYLNDGKTVKETAENLGISKRTLQLHFKKLEEIDPELHKLVLVKQEKNQNKGRIKGGTIGKRGPSYDQEEAIKIANAIVKEQLTYEEAAIAFDRPSSTIYDMTHQDFIDQQTIDSLNISADANKRGITTEQYIESKSKK